QSLIEFVDAAIAAKQPNAVVNLSFDLTQINPDGTQTTRHQLTAAERSALKYAQENNILIVAAAGNEGNLLSALGQASTEYNNILTVGASENNYRAGYSSYGEGLDILAPTSIPQTTETATTETKQGTSIAAAKVTNTISQMWAANPSLNYQQIKNILLKTAKDIDVPDWDERTGYGILDAESAIATAAETIPAIPVLAAAKLLTKPLIDADATTNNSDNSTAPKPSERATATTAPGTPKTTTRSTGDSNVGTSSHTTDLAPYKTTSTSGSNGTTTTNSRILSSFSNTESTWDKSSVKTNSKGNSFDESTSDSTTNAATHTSKSFSQNSLEQKNQSQQNYSRVKYEGTRSDSSESAQKSRSSYDYTTPTQATNNSAESYRNSKSQSNSQYGTNLSIANGNRQDDWGSKSSNSSRHTNGNNISTSKSATQTAGNADWINSSNGSSSNNTHTGDETTVTTSNSTNSNSSGFSKNSSNNDNYSVTNSTWDNTTVNGVAINSNTRDVYSEGSTNSQTSYDDGKSKNHSYQDTYTVNQSEQTNSSQGSAYRQNNRHNNYSVRQGNDTQTYKHGPQTSSRITDNYSVTKSDGYSANSSGKVTSKNNQESYSENFVQSESEYKVDAYTTTSRGDDQTITSTRSTSNNDGTNNTSSSSSDTVRTQNSQTLTVYKDGLKNENEGSSYQRWWNETATDRGVTATTNGYESWSSSYSRSEFKGGYSWSETISGTNSESVTKGGTNTSKRSDWSWTRSGTVWDDGRNNWSESWSKSNWENGRSVPGESETTRGSYNPKGTGTQTNNLPKAGEAPRLNKVPKNVVDLNKKPKHKPQPSKEFFEQPIADRPEPEKFSGDFFAGLGSPNNSPKEDKIQKFLREFRRVIAQGKQAVIDFLKGFIYHALINGVGILKDVADLLYPPGAKSHAEIEAYY
ncbi:S8 family serine peptidase, partial [Microcoleus sp. herbarium19]